MRAMFGILVVRFVLRYQMLHSVTPRKLDVSRSQAGNFGLILSVAAAGKHHIPTARVCPAVVT